MTLSFYSRFAAEPGDTQDIRSRKTAIFLLAASCSFAGILWGTIHAVVFDLGIAALIPVVFSIIVGSSLVVSHWTTNH